MILKGSQRGGSKQLANHLLDKKGNEIVTVHTVSGFITNDLKGALHEVYAQSKGTKCTQFMFTLSLSPPKNVQVSTQDFEDAAKRAAKTLGLENQPYVMVFHEKQGRRHAHCVWSRIKTSEMIAVHMSLFKKKLKALSKELYLENGWKLPKGFLNSREKNPLNFTLAEWQQAKRVKVDPRVVKNTLQECWSISYDRKSLEHALKDKGYHLARGDRRGYVAVNWEGHVFPLSRAIGVKSKEIIAKIGPVQALPSVADTQSKNTDELRDLYREYEEALRGTHGKRLAPLTEAKVRLVKKFHQQRAALAQQQKSRFVQEQKCRQSRVRKGLPAVWDWMTGAYQKIRKQNEKELKQSEQRDQKERDSLIHKQLQERQSLERKLSVYKIQFEQDRSKLVEGFSQYWNKQSSDKDMPSENNHTQSRYQGPEPEM